MHDEGNKKNGYSRSLQERVMEEINLKSSTESPESDSDSEDLDIESYSTTALLKDSEYHAKSVNKIRFTFLDT